MSEPVGAGLHVCEDHEFSLGGSMVSVRERRPLRDAHTTIVFIHGRFGSGACWEPVALELSLGYRSLNIDLPGYGRSFSACGDAPSLDQLAGMLRELIDKLAPEGVILAGHDWGGCIALACALDARRSLVRAVILVNASCIWLECPHLSTKFGAFKVRRFLKRSGCPEYWPEISIPSIDRVGRDWPDEGKRADWRRKLHRLEQPALVLSGARDEIIPPEHASSLMQELPAAHFNQHEEAGHWLTRDQPTWVAHRFVEFFARTGVSRGRRSLSR